MKIRKPSISFPIARWIAGLVLLAALAGGGFSLGIAQGPAHNFLPLVAYDLPPTLTPTVTPPLPPPATPLPASTCARDWDCADFGSQAAMWQILTACNYNLALDPWNLDADRDGEPCELLP